MVEGPVWCSKVHKLHAIWALCLFRPCWCFISRRTLSCGTLRHPWTHSGTSGMVPWVFLFSFYTLKHCHMSFFSFHVSIFLFLFFFYALVFTFWLETKRFNSDNVVSLWLGSKTHEEIFWFFLNEPHHYWSFCHCYSLFLCQVIPPPPPNPPTLQEGILSHITHPGCAPLL